MDCGDALKHIFAGQRMRRASWHPDVFVFHVPGSTFKVNRPPLLGIYPEGTEITYAGHIDVRTKDGRVGMWTPTQCDLGGLDWEFAR